MRGSVQTKKIEQVPDLVPDLLLVAHLPLAVYAVAVAATDPFTREEAALDQVRDDASCSKDSCVVIVSLTQDGPWASVSAIRGMSEPICIHPKGHPFAAVADFGIAGPSSASEQLESKLGHSVHGPPSQA
jgi:hypothetical protein